MSRHSTFGLASLAFMSFGSGVLVGAALIMGPDVVKADKTPNIDKTKHVQNQLIICTDGLAKQTLTAARLRHELRVAKGFPVPTKPKEKEGI